ncbi:hypothetical protein HDU79_009599 [Rhizoclosmatium sp. JEL0117]|nr:hypothetical protein HDU79_009599 [Rhizoclosmatium sp. JEL0117]
MTFYNLIVVTVCLLVYCVEATVTVIKGGGSTFPQQPYFSAVADFNRLYQNIQATYNATNSQTGQLSVGSGLINWGGSDTDIQTSLAGSDKLVVLPAIAGGLLIAYNLPGYSDTLKLSRTVLPRIFDGKIHPLIVKDNPFLANNSAPIRVIRQQSSKGSSVNLLKFLVQLDTENGVSPSPHSNPQTLQSIPSSLLAKNPAAINVLVGTISNTLGYLNQFEAQDAMLPSDSTVKAALIQHKDGSFIPWSGDSVKIAVTGISDAVVGNTSLQTNLIAYNLNVKGAYPLSLISNFALNPTNISSNPLEIVGTLKFLWMFLQSPQFANEYTYTSLSNTTMGRKTLNFLKTVNYSDGSPIYGLSICDVEVDGTYKKPCIHGHCIDPLPFQAPDQVCICDHGYQNVNNNDCSEQTPVFIPGFVSKVQILLFVLATFVVLTFGYLIMAKRNEPDVKAISPFCSLYILAGCLIGAVAIITKGLSTSNTVCQANAILPAIAFGMIFSMVLAKAIRIFLIFGYSKIARSRFLKDDFLISCCSLVALFEGVFTWKALDGAGIEPRLVLFDDSSDTTWACASDDAKADSAKKLLGGVFGFNAILMVLCISMGWLTRKASEKFDESKKVGLVISISALFIILDLVSL